MIRQRYRLRAPSTGREVILEAEPGRTYLDRETGEPLEVVGKLLPLPPSASQAPVGRREPALLQLVRPARPEGPQRLPDVRPPDGRAPPLTRPSYARGSYRHPAHHRPARARRRRLRRQRQLATQEVPGPPATVPIPSDTSALDAGSAPARRRRGRHADADRHGRRPDASGTAPDTQSGSTGTAQHRPDSGTGGTDRHQRTPTAAARGAPDQRTRRPTDATPPSPAPTREQFEDFCSQNPGAC